MYQATNYNGITSEMQAGIDDAARRLGVKVADVQGYFLAGDSWDAKTPAELADEIERCWREQAAEAKAEDEFRKP